MGSIVIFCLLMAAALGGVWAVATYRSVPVHLVRSSLKLRPPFADYEIEVGLGLPGAGLHRFPPYLIILLVFHEDDLFFSHGGFNWREIRARIRAYLRGAKLKGGSSITQQVAKNVFNPGALYGTWLVAIRKVREAIFALRLERDLSKDEILTLYLQCCKLGLDNLHGFERAAMEYFGKEPLQLEIPEMAFLVSLVASPTRTINGIMAGRGEAFPYRNLLGRQRDVVRFIVQGWGWGALANPRLLDMAQITTRLGQHRRFSGDLGDNFELALDLRCLSTVAGVREVVENFVAGRHATGSASGS